MSCVKHLSRPKGHNPLLRVVQLEAKIQPARGGWIVVAAALAPNLPQPVDVRVVDPEDRIKRGSRRVGHQPADVDVNEAVRRGLQFSEATATVVKARPRPAKATTRAMRIGLETRDIERSHADVPSRPDRRAVVDGRPAIGNE